MTELRPYQEQCILRVLEAYAAGARSVCLQLPTGAGKTRTAAELLRRHVEQGGRALFCAHLDTLVTDTYARLVDAGVWTGFVQAGQRRSPLAHVQVCSIQTLHARPEDRPPADLVIIDEAHRSASFTIRSLLGHYPHARILGLTGTPERGDGQPLGDIFETLVEGPTTKWLTERGFLVPCDVIDPGGFEERGLAADPVESYERHTPGTRAIVFASSVAHATALTDRFLARGSPAECVTGETSRAVREGVRSRITSGETRVLVGVTVFLEGFDAPEIETVILARGFTVTGAFLQAVGRGLRPSPATGKTKCTVLDLRGAVNLHGLPDEDRRWSLEGKAVRRTERLPALQRCKECFAIHRPARRCPRCGAEVQTCSRIPWVLSHAERLERFNALPPSERDRRYLAQLQRIALHRMRMPPHAAAFWALTRFRNRFGREPAPENAS